MEQKSEDAFLRYNASNGNSLIDVPRKVGTSIWGISRGTDVYHASSDASLFSSSLPVLSHEKLNFNSDTYGGQSVDDDLPKPNDEEAKSNTIENLLPDDDELLAGLMEDFDLSGLPSQLEDLEDCDLFGSGGGLELDFESQENFGLGLSKLSIADNTGENGLLAVPNGTGAVAGEHPYGEHPSRTLFVRNINSNVEDSELKSLFEQYGDIRTLYTTCKQRGFVMISYYDIRSARTAMRALQNKPLRRRKLDIHFSIPKDNPSEKDVNQGTLVVFNLDASISNDDLLQIFGAYGEIREIRETPHKQHHKFIEFYDVRAAEAALKALNRSDIAGKRIKLEPSRPGGAHRNLMQVPSQELEQDETRNFLQQIGSPLSSSPPGNWAQIGSPVSKSPGLGTFSPMNSNHLSGLASILPPPIANTAKMAPIGKVNHTKQLFIDSSLTQGSSSYHNHGSFPESHFSKSRGLASSLGDSNSKPSSIGTLSGPQFLWGSPTPYSAWPTSSVGQPVTSSGKAQGLSYINHHGSLLGSHHHHVGSAPLDRQSGYFSESPATSFINPIALGSRVFSLGRNNGNYLNFGMHERAGYGIGLPGNVTENGSPGYRMMSLPGQGPIFLSNGSFPGLGAVSNEGLLERSRGRRVENSMNQIDSNKQYQLDLVKIIGGEDVRTTLMIKNIPNKYTSKMLLAAIDEYHRGTYDFLYLPIDFKNKCNVGYAFINMVSPKHIIPFYEAFNGKKWEKFNSEKVASLAYARIQGKAALVTHFQNSSLMNEDKRCRPILFHSEGQEITDQDTFLSSNLNICIRQADGSYLGDSLDSPKGNIAERVC